MAIKVTLLTHTPNPEQTVAMAAKLCYSPSGIEDIRHIFFVGDVDIAFVNGKGTREQFSFLCFYIFVKEAA